MKLSYAISTQPTSFSAVYSGDWSEQAAYLGSYCYPGIELAIRDVTKVDRNALSKLIEEYNFKVSAIGTGQIFCDDGFSLSDRDASIREEAMNRLKNHIGFAKEFGAQVVLGLIRGNNVKGKSNSSYAMLQESIKEVSDFAAKLEVGLLIEPINRYETCFLNTVDETLQFIAEIERTNIKILFDTFHMNIEEKDMTESIKKAKGYVGYVHFADSNRKYPGCGHIDFDKVISTLKDIGYDGYISGEMLPWPDFKTCVKEFTQYMEKRI